MRRPLDETCNPNTWDHVPSLEEAEERFPELETWPKDSIEEFVLLNTAHGHLTILDEERLLKLTRREMRQVLRWMSYMYAAASDNIVWGKNLVQPECCVGILTT